MNNNGHASVATHTQIADLFPIVSETYMARKDAQKMIFRLSNQSRSRVRRYLGWRYDLPTKESNAICKRAENIVKSVEAGESTDTPTALMLVQYCLAIAEAKKPMLKIIADCESYMKRNAEQFPAWERAKEIKGISEVRFMSIVGEAGDLSGYDNPAKLWKRFGLGLVNGESQRHDKDPETNAAHGYSKRRRSLMYSVGDGFIKISDSPYRQVYLDRKEYETDLNPDMTKMYRHLRAHRYMEKKFLKDLWIIWKESIIM